MPALPGNNKMPGQNAADDAKRSTHGEGNETKKPGESTKDSQRTTKSPTVSTASKDSGRQDGGSPMAKKFNAEKFSKACKDEGMDDDAIEKAMKKAQDALEDDEGADPDLEKGENPFADGDKDKDDIKKAMDALSALEDKIQKGEFKFTQGDVDDINSKHTDQLERVLAQHSAFDAKVIGRLGNIESAFLSLGDLVKGQFTQQVGRLEELDALVKAIPAVKGDTLEAKDEPKDEMKKGLSGADNAPVDTPKGVTTEIKSPLDDAPKDELKKGQFTVAQIGDKARTMLREDKGQFKLSAQATKELSDVLMKSVSGVSANVLLRDHAKVLGLA